MSIKILWGVPGAGKTNYAVRKVLKTLKNGSKRHVFTNFPVHDKKLGYTKVWKPELACQLVTDSLIVVDEAYRDFNSRDYSKFQDSTHTFFATNRHLNNDILIIAHNPARIDKVIREITEEFILMHCHKIPFTKIVIWFSADVFLDEVALSQRYTAKHAIYCIERYLFSKRVGRAYDTHFFRDKDLIEPEFEDWGQVLNKIDEVNEVDEEDLLC